MNNCEYMINKIYKYAVHFSPLALGEGVKRVGLLFLLLFLLPDAHAQYANMSKKNGAGDLIESTSYNDHKRGMARTLQYRPDGEDFVCTNGENRYTRALYGSPTAWRLETSDRPIFATYVKRDCRNIRFVLHLPDGTDTPLEQTTWCEARYTPGKRTYLLTDKAWGEGARIAIAVLPSPTEEEALWQITAEGLAPGCTLEAIVAPIKNQKLSRSGDMGADPPRCFDPAEDGTISQKLSAAFSGNAPIYIGIKENTLAQVEQGGKRFAEYEEARATLAGRIRIETPDPFFNTLGGALAVAADGVWGTEGVWLHGAVGWRMPLSGWRAGYIGDALGWHDRARTHFDNYAASQVKDVPNTIPHPAQDSALALARSEKKWGTPQYSNGYICRNPQRNNQMHHYDMNLCYIDELLWHLCWTGDLDYARRMWPVLTLHLAWEKRNFDPDNDGLYDAYACIWASDALYYNSGAVTHSSAYNYRSNRLAALIAEKIGEDPTPYREEADRILDGLNKRLWLNDRGHWAEFQDFMGHKRLHKSAGAWTIYHAMDSDVANPFQAYLATAYVDRALPHIAVNAAKPDAERVGEAMEEMAAWVDAINAGDYATVATTNWLPYSWSINNVAFAEVMHTALAYFQAGRPDAGFKLLKSSVLDGMYLGESPGNFGQVSFYDAARGECYRDFGDPIGVASRVLIQGLYGILPDALNHRLLLRPGFPQEWDHASLHTPDIDFDFLVETNKKNQLLSHYTLTHQLPAVQTVEVQFPALRSQVASLKVNGKEAAWRPVENAVGRPMLSVEIPAKAGKEIKLAVRWAGEEIRSTASTPIEEHHEGKFSFTLVSLGDMKWWMPMTSEQIAQNAAVDVRHKADYGFKSVMTDKCEPVDMSQAFNANVTDIFRNEYLTPRSPYTTLQLPKQGIGEWCHPLKTANIDDAGLRAAVKEGVLHTKPGIPFRTPAEGENIAFTSLWDNYPTSLQVALQGKASHAYLLMAGSTNHMQCRIENGVIRVHYTDGTYKELILTNPDNWAPIEQFFFEDGQAFNRRLPKLTRLRLKTGEVSDNFGKEMGFPGVNHEVDGGAALLLELPLDERKELSHLTLETLSNEVVIGLMGITLQRPSLAKRFADSERKRFPQAYQLDHGKRLFFGYAQGVGACAMLKMWKATGDDSYYTYVKQWADSLINDKGEIHLYDKSTYNLDFINSGKALFYLYEETQDPRYATAMKTLIDQLKHQPRTTDGGFWHKLIYQHQMWLDGLYMASPFMAQYGAVFNQPEWIDQAVKQFQLCHKHTWDAKTGLYHHAWDESKSQRWANPKTGHSPNFWGRSIGWWFMAMVDVLDFIPQEHPGRKDIIGYIQGLAKALPKYQREGLWYQVLDCPERKGNFPEASVTTQCMYAYAKAVNKGYIDPKYREIAHKALDGLKKTLLIENADGTLTLTRCCQVGGLGGNPYRDGSFEYYIGEKMRDNDAKATGPLIMGLLEMGE